MKLIESRVEEFFAYVQKRYAITQARKRGDPWPWTDDPILQKNFFCSVHRADDRVTKELDVYVRTLTDRQQRIALLWFRLVNRVDTLKTVVVQGPACVYDLPMVFHTATYRVMLKGGLWNKETLIKSIRCAETLVNSGWRPVSLAHATWRSIKQEMDVGPFLAYQILQDVSLNYTDEWCWIGPGARRGLRYLTGELVEEDFARQGHNQRGRLRNRSYTEKENASYLPNITQLVKRSNGFFSHFDCQGNLCEFDKYLRIQSGRSTGRRYRWRGA